MATSDTGDCIEPWVHLSQEALIVIWRGIYWTTYIMCWYAMPVRLDLTLQRVIVPLMQSYVLAAHFHPGQKFVRSLKENIGLYAAGAIIGIGFGAWLMMKTHLGAYVM